MFLAIRVDQAKADRLRGQVAGVRGLAGGQQPGDQVARGLIAGVARAAVDLVELPPAIGGDLVAADGIIAVGLVRRKLGPAVVIELEELGDAPMQIVRGLPGDEVFVIHHDRREPAQDVRRRRDHPGPEGLGDGRGTAPGCSPAARSGTGGRSGCSTSYPALTAARADCVVKCVGWQATHVEVSW